MTKQAFQERLRRLHDAHTRGRENDNGPSGVYGADGPLSPAHTSPRTGQETTPPSSGARREPRAESTDKLRVITERIAPTERHGCRTLGQCMSLNSRALFELGNTLPRGIDKDRLLFMDTETSGLAMDSLAFLLGLGYWQGDEFVVEQIFLEDPSAEPQMLRQFARRLKTRDVLITFNGKRFDVPLLLKSFRRQSLESPFATSHHLDLLPAARRAIPGRRRYRLSALETDVLDFHRVGDVPGRDIPPLWSRYQRSRDFSLMKGVLEHNRHDIVSMVILLDTLLSPESPSRITRSPASNNPVRDTLERTYQLRHGSRAHTRAITQDGRTQGATIPSADAADLVAERVKSLRGAAGLLLERELDASAFPLLCEILVLTPRDEFALQALAGFYRRRGLDHVAQVLDDRLASSKDLS